LEWSLVGGEIWVDASMTRELYLEISYSNLGHRAISTKISGSLEGRRKKKGRINRTEIIIKRIISSPITTDFQKLSKLRINSQRTEPKDFSTTQILNLGLTNYT
jgi:hypothetical protein